MRAKETEGERRLSQQVIASLEARIKEQEEQIRQLTQRANEAGLQVQSIAVKAIEGASAWRALGAAHERGGEPAGR
jgi:predicted DsbA family dithiol-disulfide isomerase